MIQPDEQMIWDYLDGNLDEELKLQLEKRIKEDAETNALFEKINALEQLLHTQQTEQPSLRFHKNVREKISVAEAVSLIPRFNPATVSRIVLTLSIFSILVSGFVPVVYNQTNLFPQSFSNDAMPMFFQAIIAFWGVVLFDRWKTRKVANHS